MNTVKIEKENIGLLEVFIRQLGDAKKSFRYFNSRSAEVIENHLATIMFVNETTQPVAYGHLDKENEDVWLGVCVLPAYKKLGYGKKMMQTLINSAHKLGVTPILLTVDKDNSAAIQLYEKFNFKVTEETATYFKYRLDI